MSYSGGEPNYIFLCLKILPYFNTKSKLGFHLRSGFTELDSHSLPSLVYSLLIFFFVFFFCDKIILEWIKDDCFISGNTFFYHWEKLWGPVVTEECYFLDHQKNITYFQLVHITAMCSYLGVKATGKEKLWDSYRSTYCIVISVPNNITNATTSLS